MSQFDYMYTYASIHQLSIYKQERISDHVNLNDYNAKDM